MLNMQNTTMRTCGYIFSLYFLDFIYFIVKSQWEFFIDTHPLTGGIHQQEEAPALNEKLFFFNT